MRWISYIILAYVVLGLQAGMARAIEWHSAGPNFVLLAVIFIAMNAPRDAALLGSFMLGGMHDLISQGTLGLYALSYGLVALVIVGIQQAVYREHPLTHLILTWVAALLTAFILALHGWIRPPLFAPSKVGVNASAINSSIVPLLYSTFYSAILAPFVLGILQRMRRLFRFQSSRRRIGATGW